MCNTHIIHYAYSTCFFTMDILISLQHFFVPVISYNTV